MGEVNSSTLSCDTKPGFVVVACLSVLALVLPFLLLLLWLLWLLLMLLLMLLMLMVVVDLVVNLLGGGSIGKEKWS
jgi:hypothetical protein